MLRLAFAAVLFSGILHAAYAASPKRPNILFIYADDQSYKTLSCYPEALPGVKTPHIDKLAATGIRFHGAFLGSWCMPSRATMLTGHHPHGVESMRMEGKYPASAYDPQQCPFWPKTWREKGYTTAHIGKWHTGVDAGTGRDWDWQIVWNRPLHPENAGKYYEGQILSFNGAEERMTEGYSTDNYTKGAREFIKGEHRDKDKPWYLWLCYGAIHGPTTPADRHMGLHKNDEVRIPADIFPPREGKPEYVAKNQAWSKGPNGEIFAAKRGETSSGQGAKKKPSTYQDFIHQVNECVEALDEGVGGVMEALRESGQLENTLVIYSADQGFAMGEHGFRIKLAPYDANYRSPLIVSMPGTLPQGKVAPHCVTGPDLVATFHAFAGIEPAWKMHGHDLTPLLKNPEAGWPHPAFYQNTGDRYGREVARIVNESPKDAAYHGVPWYVVVREDRWKLIRYLEAGVGEELYDLKNDPEELTNVIARAENKEVLERLRGLLKAELKRTDAGFE